MLSSQTPSGSTIYSATRVISRDRLSIFRDARLHSHLQPEGFPPSVSRSFHIHGEVTFGEISPKAS